MRQQTYQQIRAAYYIGIFLLVLYALPALPLVKELLYPLMNYEILTNLPIVSIVAIATGVGAFAAYKYRKIG